MCFRPATVSMKNCPNCGKVNKPIATVCEECGTELDNTVQDFDADQAALDSAIKVPGASSASGAPPLSAPSAPKAPGSSTSAPGAPPASPPSAPKAPSAPPKTPGS